MKAIKRTLLGWIFIIWVVWSFLLSEGYDVLPGPVSWYLMLPLAPLVVLMWGGTIYLMVVVFVGGCKEAIKEGIGF